MVVLDADELARRRARARTWSRGTPGAGRGRRPRASPRTAARSARCPRGTTRASRSSRGRRCGGRPTRGRPAARQNVFLSSAPTASSGGAAATGRAARRDVAARAAHDRPAAHDGVVGARVDRAVVRRGSTSAMPASRSSASSSRKAIGSSETLPLVITSGTPASASSRWCSGVYGSITPSSAERGRDGRRRPRAPGRRAREDDRPRAATSERRARPGRRRRARARRRGRAP